MVTGEWVWYLSWRVVPLPWYINQQTICITQRCLCYTDFMEVTVLTAGGPDNWACINSWWPDDVIWCHGSWSPLPHVIAWYLSAPSHYLKQGLLITNWNPWNKLHWNQNQNKKKVSHKKLYLKTSSAKCQAICSALSVLRIWFNKRSHEIMIAWEPFKKTCLSFQLALWLLLACHH